MRPEDLIQELYWDLLKLKQMDYSEDELHNLLWEVYRMGYDNGYMEAPYE